MKNKKCPRCGGILIEETYEDENRGSSSMKETGVIPSGCSNYSGSIDFPLMPGTRSKTTIYRCINPECGYLSTDC